MLKSKERAVDEMFRLLTAATSLEIEGELSITPMDENGTTTILSADDEHEQGLKISQLSEEVNTALENGEEGHSLDLGA